MERNEEITPENDDPILPEHPSEVLLTIPATDDYFDIFEFISTNSDSSYSHSSNLSNIKFENEIFGTVERTGDWGEACSSDEYDERITRNHEKPKKEKPEKEKPEKELINFAFRIVVMEKTANGIGLLAFIWATVVLLGGFASTLKTIDFGFITTIVFMVGTGIFNRNHQLDPRFFFQAAKVISSTIGRYFTILQFSFACICIALSAMRLLQHNYSEDPHTTNTKVAIYIFYAMALIHGVLFLLKKAYWLWMVYYSKIIQEVCNECQFGESGELLVQRFFYEAYWKLSKGSVFRALDLDFITFAQALLISSSPKDQLIAIRILYSFINHRIYSKEMCPRLKASTETISRLLKMLTWIYQDDGTIRTIIATIVERLASGLLVEDIPGAMDCIHSLLTVPKGSQNLNEKTLTLNLLGLNILKKLAGNPKNCWKIRETCGLLPMIVKFMKYKNDCIQQPLDQLKIVKSSLMLLSKIITTEGETGEILRRNISKIAFTVSNLRDILIDGGTNPMLFRCVVKILATLSIDMNARKKIGSTSGIIKVLLSIFFQLSCSSYECELRVKGGRVLAILLLQSKRNCSEILNLKGAVEKLIKILSSEVFIDPHLRVSYWKIDRKHQKRTVTSRAGLKYKIMAMNILRNLCAYAGSKWHDKLKDVVNALPRILEAIMSTKNDCKLLEASIGLCVQICKFISIEKYTNIPRNVDYSMDDVARKLLKVLEEIKTPNIKFPCLRRYALELAIWMMESNARSISSFREGKLEEVLIQVSETTSDLENFHFFFGDTGVAKHSQTISSLVLKAERLLA